MMKKYSILLILAGINLSIARACDICGCGVGSYYLGILPEFNKKFAGLRYQYKTLHTHLGPAGERTPLTTNETYQRMEIWSGWNIGQKFRILAIVPYHFNKQNNETENSKKNGPGDIAVMGYFNLINQRTSFGPRLFVHSLWLGAGIKLPVGVYESSMQNTESPNNFQLGTGSTDFSLNAAYDARLQDIGLNANISYKINSENRFHYQYGHNLTFNTLIYYKFRLAKKLTLAPNAGILYETAQKDTENKKYRIDSSGGYALSAVTGLELSSAGFSLGANFQQISRQNLAGGRVWAGNRLMLHLSIPI